jgi:hypothetical protein
MLSITGVGALTKPLLGMLLRDGGDRMLAAQLSSVPLLGCAAAARREWCGRRARASEDSHAGALRPAMRLTARTERSDPWARPHDSQARRCPTPPRPRRRNTYMRVPLGDDADGAPGVALGRVADGGGGGGGGGTSGGGAGARAAYRVPAGGGYSGRGDAEQPGTPGGGGGGGGGSGGADDQQRRLPLPVRNLVDRLSAFDRDVLFPVFGRADSISEAPPQGAAPAAGGPAQHPQQPPGGGGGVQGGGGNFTLM